MDPAVVLPLALGLSFLAAGLWSYRRDLRWAAIAPVLIAAPLAAFAGEHFTLAPSIARMVPGWLPARLFIAYFVGVAELAAALSFVARRAMRWSTILLAIMFALFALLMDLRAAVASPHNRLFWILAVRETTFAMSGLALYAVETRSPRLAAIARWWMAFAIVYYGIDHLLHPQLAPGVPNVKTTAAWVPLPLVVARTTGALLIAFGTGMLVRKYARAAATAAGLLMLLLTVVLYVPDLFLAGNDTERLGAINFVFDTMLFSGTLLAAALSSRTDLAPEAQAPHHDLA